MESYRVLDSQLLVCMDGTEFFNSNALSCPRCSTCTRTDGTVNHDHSALIPAIVQPGNSRVIPLPPEIIRPQDGHEKQDCENAAAKRWINRWGCLCKTLGVTISPSLPSLLKFGIADAEHIIVYKHHLSVYNPDILHRY